MTTLEFFHALYGAAGPQGHFYIWVKWPAPSKISKTIWVDTLEEAVAVAQKYDGECDVYFGVGTSNRKKSNNQRAVYHDVCMFPAFVLDVDYAGPGHLKPGLPATRELALEIIEASPLKPTILVSSGAGFHAYWKFKEPATLTTHDQRAAFTTMHHSWQDWFRAKHPGITFDQVHDLPRILRVPGILNMKSGRVPCTVLKLDGPEYSLDDFRPFIVAQPVAPVQSVPFPRPDLTPSAPQPVQAPGGIIMSPFPLLPGFFLEGNAKPRTPDQFDAPTLCTLELLMENDAFRRLVADNVSDKSTTDIKAVRLYINRSVNDNTNPSYQIAADIISHIRHQPGHTDDDKAKALRADYLEMTIIKKVVNATRPLAEAKPKEPKPAPVKGEKPAPPGATPKVVGFPDTRTAIEIRYAMIEKEMGLPIRNLCKYIGTDMKMSLEAIMPSGEVRQILFTTKELIQLKLFEVLWSSATGFPIVVSNQSDWKGKVFNKIIGLFEEIEMPEEATEIGTLKQGIINYLWSGIVYDNRNDALSTLSPFWTVVRGNPKPQLFFFFDSFIRFLVENTKGERVSAAKVATTFKITGLTKPTQLPFEQRDGNTVNIRVYAVPLELVTRFQARTISARGGMNPSTETEEEAWQPDSQPIH